MKKNKQTNHLLIKGFLTFQILHELRKKGLCGDELAKIIGKKKGSKLTPGTIYPALKYLRRKKLVSRKKNGRKKVYKLTEEGKKEYKIFRKNFLKMFKDIFK
ncbi:MAG: PadR family transcriptional regulator [Nanoarchaeota archaeon]|nr:PadR family transcriptional regulator [Nanoarchaeota archaeon]